MNETNVQALAGREVLVTGGAGFIGGHVVERLLAAKARVRVLDNLSTGTVDRLPGGADCRFEHASVLEDAALDRMMTGCDIVIHLAAEVGNLNSLEHPFRDAETNALGTLAVALAAQRHGVQRLVYASSAAIFGEPQRLPIDEAHPVAPESYYGVSKLSGEKYLLAVAKVTGLQAAPLRYFNVYGRGQRYNPYANVIPIFVDRLLRGLPPIVYGDGEQTRDFVHVGDVARATLLAATSVAHGMPINIGSGHAISVNTLVALFLDIIGAPHLKP